MADEIFLVNSSSFQDVEISASLKTGPNTIVDFTQTAVVTGSFSGIGVRLTHISASYIIPEANTTASYANTSSWAINAINGGTQLITGSTMQITSSWANNAISASWTPFTDTGTTLYTGSTYEITSSRAVTSSYATWAGLSPATTLYTASTYQITASSAISASWAPDIDSGYSTSASFASRSLSSSYIIPGATFQIVSGSNGIQSAYIDVYDISTGSYVPSYKEGRMWYDGQYHNMDYYTDDSGFRCQIGKELIIGIHNPYTTSLSRLTVVYVSGSTGENPDVYKAIADGSGLKSKIIGVIRSNIESGSSGYMLTRGVMHRSNMIGYTVGDSLWLSPTIPGALTLTRPSQPYEEILVGYCSKGGTTGSFVCAIQEYSIANIYAGMTSVPTIKDSLNSASLDFTSSLYIDSGSVNLFNNIDGTGRISGYAVSPATLSLAPGGLTGYIYAVSNGVTASYGITTDFSSINQINKVPVATVYRADVDAHWIDTNEEGLALANKLNQRFQSTERFSRESGFTLAETGSRFITITEGAAWFGATRFTEHSFDSRLSGSDFQSGSFHELHLAYKSSSVWVTPVISDGKYENRYYNSGSTLAPLSQSQYTLNYVFRIFGENDGYDEDAFILLSNYQYNTVQEAQSDVLPADIPAILSEIGLLVGRIIIQSGSNNAALIESSFVATFGTSIINNHNNLAGLEGGAPGDYKHLTSTEYAGTGTGVFVRTDGPTITNANISGSLFGTVSTASYVIQATSASYVATASYVDAATFITIAQTASYVATASFVESVVSASYAKTSSWAINAINGGTQLITGSSYPITSSWSISSSWSPGQGATTIVTGSTLQITSSYVVNEKATFLFTGSTYPITSSWSNNSVSASYSSIVTTSFSRGGTFYDPYGIAGQAALSQSVMIWRAPFACTATNIYGYIVANSGVTASLTAWNNGRTMLKTPIQVTGSSIWTPPSASALISTSFSIGDTLQIVLLTSSFAATQSAIQIDFTKP